MVPLGHHDFSEVSAVCLSSIRVPSADARPEATQENKSDLRFKHSSFKRSVFLLDFTFLFLFSVTGGVLAIRWPWQDRDPSFVAQWGISTIFVIISQWSVFQFFSNSLQSITEEYTGIYEYAKASRDRARRGKVGSNNRFNLFSQCNQEAFCKYGPQCYNKYNVEYASAAASGVCV